DSANIGENGYSDWYIAQPDTQNPDSPNPRCIPINFAEKKGPELVIPSEWLQRYHRIAKLIAFGGSASFPTIFTALVIFKAHSLVRYRQSYEYDSRSTRVESRKSCGRKQNFQTKDNRCIQPPYAA